MQKLENVKSYVHNEHIIYWPASVYGELILSKKNKNTFFIDVETKEIKEDLNPFGSDTDDSEEELESPTASASIILETPGNENEPGQEVDLTSHMSDGVQVSEKEAAGPQREAASSNPFEDSSEDEEDLKTNVSSNPFLSSGDEEEEDEFDESNPFAEEARAETRQSIRLSSASVSSSSFERNSSQRLSQNDRIKLKKFGVEESNPFAEDLLEDGETDDIDTPNKTQANSTSNNKKLVLKTRQGHKVRAPVPPSATAQQTPKSKKRAAPKAPTTALTAIDPQSSLRRSVKKRAAPPPPSQPAAEKKSETLGGYTPSPPKPPRRESSKSNTLPGMAQYANIVFDSGNLLSVDSKHVDDPIATTTPCLLYTSPSPRDS